MAISIHRVCSSCHHHSGACGDAPTAGETCTRYEHQLTWLARQVAILRQAEITTRLLLVIGAIALAFPLAAWVVLSDGDLLSVHAQRPATKVLTASMSGGMTATR